MGQIAMCECMHACVCVSHFNYALKFRFTSNYVLICHDNLKLISLQRTHTHVHTHPMNTHIQWTHIYLLGRIPLQKSYTCMCVCACLHIDVYLRITSTICQSVNVLVRAHLDAWYYLYTYIYACVCVCVSLWKLIKSNW